MAPDWAGYWGFILYMRPSGESLQPLPVAAHSHGRMERVGTATTRILNCENNPLTEGRKSVPQSLLSPFSILLLSQFIPVALRCVVARYEDGTADPCIRFAHAG